MVSNIFIFNPTWGNNPIWLIFFKWVGTTNQDSNLTTAHIFFEICGVKQHQVHWENGGGKNWHGATSCLIPQKNPLKGDIPNKYPLYKVYMGVSKNGGTPKWMVYMESPIKIDDLGVPPFKETSIWCWWLSIPSQGYHHFPCEKPPPIRSRWRAPWMGFGCGYWRVLTFPDL